MTRIEDNNLYSGHYLHTPSKNSETTHMVLTTVLHTYNSLSLGFSELFVPIISLFS